MLNSACRFLNLRNAMVVRLGLGGFSMCSASWANGVVAHRVCKAQFRPQFSAVLWCGCETDALDRGNPSTTAHALALTCPKPMTSSHSTTPCGPFAGGDEAQRQRSQERKRSPGKPLAPGSDLLTHLGRVEPLRKQAKTGSTEAWGQKNQVNPFSCPH